MADSNFLSNDETRPEDQGPEMAAYDLDGDVEPWGQVEAPLPGDSSAGDDSERGLLERRDDLIEVRPCSQCKNWPLWMLCEDQDLSNDEGNSRLRKKAVYNVVSIHYSTEPTRTCRNCLLRLIFNSSLMRTSRYCSLRLIFI
jgi:hypothetical protein